jgi:hypothetical protein
MKYGIGPLQAAAFLLAALLSLALPVNRGQGLTAQPHRSFGLFALQPAA